MKGELLNKVKESELKLKKAQEESFIKERLIVASKNEVENLQNLTSFLQTNNEDLKTKNECLFQGIGAFKTTTEDELKNINILLNNLANKLNETSKSLGKEDSDNKNLKEELASFLKTLNTSKTE